MSDIEKRLRDAFGAAAETVDESRPRRPLPPRKPRKSRFPAWFLPLCAAASVIAVVVGFLALRSAGREPQPLDKPMPKFFITTMPSDGKKPSRLEVRDTATGGLLDSREAEPGVVFSSLAATGDGRTFLMAAEETSAKSGKGTETVCRPEIRKIGIGADGRITRIRTVVETPTIGLNRSIKSLTVDSLGSKIAYTVYPCEGIADDTVRLDVVDIRSGRHQSWETRKREDLSSLSLAEGNRLFFVRAPTEGGDPEVPLSAAQSIGYGVYRIDLSAPSGGDIENVAIPERGITPGMEIMLVAVPKDGSRLYVREGRYDTKTAKTGENDGFGASVSRPYLRGEIIEYSSVDGRAVRTIPVPEVGYFDADWLRLDASGRYLLSRQGMTDLAAGELVTELSMLAGASDAAW